MKYTVDSLIQKAKSPTSSYIIVNIIVSSVGFLRSFIFMRWLGLEELGLISLAQTVMQFISLFQIGLINGGYRLFSMNKVDDQRKVNNLLFTFFATLLAVFLLAWFVIAISGHQVIMSNDLLLVSIVCGILMLTNNWLNNTLIGKQKFSEINKINLYSIGFSVVCLLSVTVIGFWGAVLSIAIQPLVFVAFTLIRNKDLRPDAFCFDFRLVKYILSFGFIPFLAGIFTMVNLQIERWSIASVLGEEALGRFYLVFLYQSLFLLVPTSIQSIFFPQAVRSFDESNLTSFKSIIKKQSFAMATYDLLIMLITGLFFEAVVKLLFPLHADNTVFVYYFIPGLLAMSFVEVTGLVLMASVRLGPILIGGITNLLVNIVLISVMIKFNEMTLTRMAMLKSLLYIIPLVIQLTYILFNWKTLRVGYVSKMAH